MERRLHTRHRARTTVYVIMPGGGRRLCRAVNLSANGVFVRTTALGLRKGQHVELAFAIDQSSAVVAMVVCRRTLMGAYIIMRSL